MEVNKGRNWFPKNGGLRRANPPISEILIEESLLGWKVVPRW